MLAVHQPYPFYYYRRGLFKKAATYFLVIFFFLWFFEPFTVNREEQKVNYAVICLLHAFSPVLIFCLYFLILGLVLSEKAKQRWTVGKEILHLCTLFFLFGVASFLMRDLIYTNPDNWSWCYFFEEVKNTFLGGSLMTVFLILLNFYRLNSTTQKRAVKIDNHLPARMTDSQVNQVSIQTQVKADDFVLNITDFIFAQAEGNYAEIFCKEGDAIKKELKRISLLQLETQLQPFKFIFRSHRAYLINIRHVQHVTGNAQGYWLSFLDVAEKIPVSRGKIVAFDKVVAN